MNISETLEYKKFSCNKLKTLCKEFGIKTTGKKN